MSQADYDNCSYCRLSSHKDWTTIRGAGHSIQGYICCRFVAGPTKRESERAATKRNSLTGKELRNAPERIRTPNLRFRRPMLYPIEPQALYGCEFTALGGTCQLFLKNNGSTKSKVGILFPSCRGRAVVRHVGMDTPRGLLRPFSTGLITRRPRHANPCCQTT